MRKKKFCHVALQLSRKLGSSILFFILSDICNFNVPGNWAAWLHPAAAWLKQKLLLNFSEVDVAFATCHGRTKTGEGCVQWAFLVWKTSSKTTRHRDWMTAVSYVALNLPFQCVCCPWFVSSLHFFPSCTFLEITSWPQWCDTCADCRPYEPVDTNYGGEPGTYGGRQVSWHQLFLKGMGVSKNRGTPKWMVYNGKPYFLIDDLGGKPTIFGNIRIGTARKCWKKWCGSKELSEITDINVRHGFIRKAGGDIRFSSCFSRSLPENNWKLMIFQLDWGCSFFPKSFLNLTGTHAERCLRFWQCSSLSQPSLQQRHLKSMGFLQSWTRTVQPSSFWKQPLQGSTIISFVCFICVS